MPYRKKESILEESDLERESNRRNDLMRPGRDAIQNVYPEEAIAPVARTAAQGIKKGIESISKKIDMVSRPKVKNTVVSPKETKQTVLSGRIPKSEKDVTHAYRQVSSRELEDIKKTGFAKRDSNPELTKRTWKDDEKWWSAGDKEGIYGRNWVRPESTTVRANLDKVPKDRAVRTKDLEVLNKETKQFESLEDVNKKNKWKGIM